VHEALYGFLKCYYEMPEWEGSFSPDLDGLTELNLINYNTTVGWAPAIMQKIKSLATKIKMHLGGLHGNENQRS
jgi:hypothetical protein